MFIFYFSDPNPELLRRLVEVEAVVAAVVAGAPAQARQALAEAKPDFVAEVLEEVRPGINQIVQQNVGDLRAHIVAAVENGKERTRQDDEARLTRLFAAQTANIQQLFEARQPKVKIDSF